jgi:beta-galactosidase
VKLLLNGRSLGTKARPPEPAPWLAAGYENLPLEKSETYPEHLEWKVPYQAGILQASGKRNGQVACSPKIYTTGDPQRIELSLLMNDFVEKDEIAPLRADGKDIVVIKASVVDQAGHVVPTADNKIDFSVSGPGKIIGVGNGNIASHEANKAEFRKAYNGLCVVIVQSTLEAGKIIIGANSSDLIADKISIVSVSSELSAN